jgi:hypothetical protein
VADPGAVHLLPLRKRSVQTEKHRQRSKGYRSTPAGKQKHRAEMYRYLRVRRHLDTVLKNIIDETEILSMPELVECIYDSRKVRFKPGTIQRLLNMYVDKLGISPLEKVDEENYKLSRNFYRNKAMV